MTARLADYWPVFPVQSSCIQSDMYMEVLCIACAYGRLFFEIKKLTVCFIGYEPKGALTSLVDKTTWLKWPPF